MAPLTATLRAGKPNYCTARKSHANDAIKHLKHIKLLLFIIRMEIDESLLERSQLSPYEKELIRLIDIQGIEVTKVALQKEKDKSTISIQHNKALEKLQKFMEGIKYKEISGELASRIFAQFEKGMEPAKIVIKLKQAPEVVKAKYEQWLELKKLDVNLVSHLNQIEQIKEELRRLKESVDALWTYVE